MSKLRFTSDHEWVSVEDNDIAIVGITDYAQSELGDVVFVELPEIDASFHQGDQMAVVESVKTAADVMAPISGTVVAINEELESSPELVNDSPVSGGWFCKLNIQDAAELDALMSESEYEEFISDNA